jgi:ankyrin repeat protein
MSNLLKKMLTIALVISLFSTPAHGMDAPKVAIVEAARRGNLEKVNQLIKKDKASVNKSDENGFTALMIAATRGNLDCIKALINAGSKVDQADTDGRTALMFVVQIGHANCLQALIAANAQVNQTDHNGLTALTVAAQNGHSDIMKLLLENGANATHALRHGIKYDRCDSIKNLLDNGVDVNMPITSRNETAFYRAAQKGKTNMVLELLLKQANANQARIDGITPLMIAAQNGHINIVDMLINLRGIHAVDVNARAEGYHNVSALYLAAQNGKADVVALLLRKGADFNITADNGTTPLMTAAAKGHKKIVTLLLHYGADDTLKNKNGCTAHDLALKHNHNDISKLLILRSGK